VFAQNVIPDVCVLKLERKGERLVILHESHYLLRRFGQVELVALNENHEEPFSLREFADEIWSLVAGEVSLTLVDKRSGSPSENQSMQLKLSETQPQAILIPFGVAYHFKAAQDSRLIRITTHADGLHDEDRTLYQDEIDPIDLTT
jgi:hypothetical protein